MRMRLSGGDSVLVHLGMSGRMVARPAVDPPPAPAAREAFALETTDGPRVGSVGPRRSGGAGAPPARPGGGRALRAGNGGRHAGRLRGPAPFRLRGPGGDGKGGRAPAV